MKSPLYTPHDANGDIVETEILSSTWIVTDKSKVSGAFKTEVLSSQNTSARRLVVKTRGIRQYVNIVQRFLYPKIFYFVYNRSIVVFTCLLLKLEKELSKTKTICWPEGTDLSIASVVS